MEALQRKWIEPATTEHASFTEAFGSHGEAGLYRRDDCYKALRKEQDASLSMGAFRSARKKKRISGAAKLRVWAGGVSLFDGVGFPVPHVRSGNQTHAGRLGKRRAALRVIQRRCNA